MNGHTAALAVIVVLFAFSAVLALSETAFVRVSRIRMLNLAEEGDKRAERVLRLLEHPEQTLNSVLLVLLACQMISATLLGTVLEPTFGTAGVVLGMVIEITVVFTFAEVAPKTFAVQHAERAVMARVGAARVPHEVPAVAHPHARLHRPRQHRAARARVCAAGRSSPRTRSSRWPTSPRRRRRSRPRSASSSTRSSSSATPSCAR